MASTPGWLVFAIASLLLLYVTVAEDDADETLPSTDEKMLFDDFRYPSGGYARTYDKADCPAPYFAGNSFEVIDHWPDGANIQVTVKPNGPVTDGWTMLVVFSRTLPKGAKILIWNAEETARKEGRYFTFVNRAHNPNLNNIEEFSLTFVIEGATMLGMSGYSAMISFYPERIRDAACYLSGSNQPAEPPTTTRKTTTTTTTRRYVPTTMATTRRITTRRTRPVTRSTARPTKRPVRRTTVAPRRTTRKAPFYKPKEQARRATARPSRPRTTPRPRPRTTPRPYRPRTTKRTSRPRTTPRPYRPRTTKRTSRPRTTPRPYRPRTTPRPYRPRTTRRPSRPRTTPRPKTRKTTTTQRPVTIKSEFQANSGFDYKKSSKMVMEHRGKCRVLPKGYEVQNPGYDAGNDLADGRGRRYNFNIQINVPVKDIVRDWTVKIVFAEPIEAIQTWEAIAEEHSSDGTVWLIKPREWNTELHETSEFVMIPLMRTEKAPPAIVYLCEDGDEPTLLGNGIFERTDGGGHKLTDEEIREMERREKERQESIKQEQEQRLKEQREREREEKERREKNENRRQEETHTQSPYVHRTLTVQMTTPRPRLSGPRCTGSDGYPAKTSGQTKVTYKKSPANERLPYDYNEILAMSILFYEAQRSGKLPSNNRIPWRGDSGLKDGCDVGHDLTGGWYDAGDHVKFGFPMAWSATTLAWGAIEFGDAYKDANEFRNMLASLKWVADFFVKAHTAKYEFYAQVGDGGPDHSYWGKAEDMKMKRPAFKIDRNNPGTEVAAETAAALAAISIVFKSENPTYSKMLLRHAEELYEFGDKYRGEYHKSVPAAQGYYRSYNGFKDELVWGALWLAKATGSKTYLADAVRKYQQFGGDDTPKMFSWDDKRAGSQVLIAELTGDNKYRSHIMAYQNFLMNFGKTPKGMIWLDQWGSNRYAANAATITLAAANLKPPMREKPKLIAFARKQIHLMLGDAGRSYVVGYGRNPPQRPHHRSSSCPPPPKECTWNSAFENPGGNYFTLYGALVGGPNDKGVYIDKRSDYVSNEVATDFNAGFQSAVAGLKHFQIEARKGGNGVSQEQIREMEKEQKKLQESIRNELDRENTEGKWQPHTQKPSNRWPQPQPITTTRPRPSGSRCSGSSGYPATSSAQTRVTYKKSPSNERTPYDYNEVLSMSILFYEVQRSGKLPSNNRIPWRGDSGMKDGCDVGHDLTGGWYDAGDHVKFGFPMAWSATTLAWGAIEFQDAYKDAGEFKNMLESLKWVADYFVKAHTSKYELYAQVGSGGADHSYWGRPEDMNMPRPAYKIDRYNPGSEVAAETAAALAAISIVFKSENPGYSRSLLKHAEELYELADKFRGDYHKSIPDVTDFYRSYSGFNDELIWGALWLAKATGKPSYLSDAKRKYADFGGGNTPKMFSWDDKRAGCQVLMAQLTGESQYRSHVMAYQNFLKNYGTTPKGMIFLDQWGSNRYAANAAFISLAAANLKPALREKSQLIAFGRKQIHLLLGDAGRSYVIGYGRNPPARPHHRSSSCPPSPGDCGWNSAFENPGKNHYTLYGALVGGPNERGSYDDRRSDYVSNEVATDFNAGFQSALAGLKHFQIENRRG